MAGEAIEVPDRLLPWPVVAPSAEKTETPGAVMSGLMALSARRGPAEVKSAMCAVRGVADDARVLDGDGPAVVGREPVLVTPLTPMNGMVTPRDGVLVGRQPVGVVDHDDGGRVLVAGPAPPDRSGRRCPG